MLTPVAVFLPQSSFLLPNNPDHSILSERDRQAAPALSTPSTWLLILHRNHSGRKVAKHIGQQLYKSMHMINNNHQRVGIDAYIVLCVNRCNRIKTTVQNNKQWWKWSKWTSTFIQKESKYRHDQLKSLFSCLQSSYLLMKSFNQNLNMTAWLIDAVLTQSIKWVSNSVEFSFSRRSQANTLLVNHWVVAVLYWNLLPGTVYLVCWNGPYSFPWVGSLFT